MSLPFFAVLALVLAMAGPARAQELSVLAGGHDGDLNALAWEIDYRQELGAHAAVSASWLNEGHVSHVGHRDGFTLQLWGETPRFQGISLAAGAGIYTYFATESLADESFEQEHGILPVVSLFASYRTHSPWSVRFLFNEISPGRETRTTTYLLGAGYRFDDRDRDRQAAGAGAPDVPGLRTAGELTLLAGMASTNSQKSQSSPAVALEYRRRLARFWEGTLSYIDEGDTQISRRQGVAGQAVLMRELLRGRLTLGLGAGAYWSWDRPAGAVTRDGLSGILMLTAALRCRTHGLVRIGLVRIVTNDDRDSDVVLAGFGYRWGGEESARPSAAAVSLP
jgi:hypothetical protein